MKIEKKAYLLLVFLGILLVFRAFRGVDYTDEAFYFAVTRRFATGDLPLIDEWHPCQLIGILLLPFYSVYTNICGSQEGIVLCARLLYVFYSMAIVIYMMHVLVKNGFDRKYSFLAALPFCIYARANVVTFSYYNLGLTTFLLAILLYWDVRNSGKGFWKYICAGISFSVSVLCMPYMAVVFLIFTAFRIVKRKSVSSYSDVAGCMIGIGASAAIFLCSYGSALLKGLTNLSFVMSDPAHEGTTVGKIVGVITYVFFTYLKYLWPLYAVTFVAAVLIRAKGKKKYVPIVRAALYFEFVMQAVYSRTYFEGGIIVSFLLLAVQLQALNTKIREKNLESCFLYPGLLFGLAWIVGSDTGMRVLNMGCLMADVWALKIVLEDGKQAFGGKMRFEYIPVAILFGVLLLNRFFDIYRDNVIWELDTQVSCGSMKGLYTTAQRAEEYETTVQCLRENVTVEDRLAVPGLNCWIYLDAPVKVGAYSVWYVDFEDENYWEYYDINPENTPDVILQLDPSYGKYTGWRFGSHGDNTEGTNGDRVAGVLETILEEADYRAIPLECGTLYRRN